MSFNFEKVKPEKVFVLVVFIFGVLSSILTFPLANGDEGFHLSQSYNMFSKNHPESMSVETLRGIEAKGVGDSKDVIVFESKKIIDVEKDDIKFNLLKDNNLISHIDIAHLPPALGILVARKIHPTYGSLLFAARISNLIFFVISFFLIIKFSKIGKWSLFMLFTVPFIQKMVSPSYDVFSYVAFSAFSVNSLSLTKRNSFKGIQSSEICYSIFTIILLLFAKNNYIFSLLIVFVPLLNKLILNIFSKMNRVQRVLFFILVILLIMLILLVLNNVFDLNNFIKIFFKSYLNLPTIGRRGQNLFKIVPLIFPEIFNILWILAAFTVMITESTYNWNKDFTIISSSIFFINWIGIFAGFYLILGHPTEPFDDLSGRYLHPYILYFLPLLQRFGYQNNFKVSKKTISKIAMLSTTFIFIFYLIFVYYRGFILHINPTW